MLKGYGVILTGMFDRKSLKKKLMHFSEIINNVSQNHCSETGGHLK